MQSQVYPHRQPSLSPEALLPLQYALVSQTVPQTVIPSSKGHFKCLSSTKTVILNTSVLIAAIYYIVMYQVFY